MRYRDRWKWYWQSDTATLRALEIPAGVRYDLRSARFVRGGELSTSLAVKMAGARGYNGTVDAVLDRLIEEAWSYIRLRITDGNPPHVDEIAGLVRLYPIPPDMRGFIADSLEGKVMYRAGRPRRERAYWIERLVTAHRVRRWQRVYAHPRHAARLWRRKYRLPLPHPWNAYREAINTVSEETGVPVDTLDKWCGRRARQ